jgi:glycosyltransferase involved in cell wall biosynthesis
MKYSFVIPTYNNRDNLKNSLQALVVQAGYAKAHYEVVVVDDGSSDNLSDSLGDFHEELNLRLVRLERDELSSRSRARNFGWKNSHGDFIVFIDSDIIVKKDHLKQLDRYFDVDDGGIVIGNRVHSHNTISRHAIENGSLFDNFGFRKEDISFLDYRYMTFSALSFNARVVPDPWLHAYSCNIAMSRKWLVKTGGFDEKMLDWGLEDLEFAYRLYKENADIHVNPYLEVIHQNLGHRDDISISRARMDGYLKNIEYFLSVHPAALAHCPDPIQVLVKGHEYTEFSMLKTDVCVDNFDDHVSAENFAISIANTGRGARRVILLDHAEQSGLDVHVQNFKDPACPIYYFPLARRIDVARMRSHIEAIRCQDDVKYRANPVQDSEILISRN